MSSWTEIADGVFTRRFEPVDITVTAVTGGDSLLVCDTRCSVQEGRELLAELRKLTPLPVRRVVNTHTHFDHMWGNAAFDTPYLEPPAEFWGHKNMPDFDPEDPSFQQLREYLLREGGPQWQPKLDELVVRRPDHLVGREHTLDLGGRVAELRHPGRGHTDNDLVIWLPDVAVAISGDLIEQSGPVAFGVDSFPLDWPDTLAALADLTTEDTVYVPGHGDARGRGFLREQQEFVTRVAEQIVGMYEDGVPVEDAAKAGDWPLGGGDTGGTGSASGSGGSGGSGDTGDAAGAHFRSAVKRGYAQLSGRLP